MRLLNLLATAGLMLAATTSQAGTQTTSSGAVLWSGDGSYLSQADIPAGFYASGSPTLLDNLEDGSLDATLTASSGQVNVLFVDSVDIDDGLINGNCSSCHSWSTNTNTVTFTFTGTVLPTAFAVVWTDGFVNSSVTLSATDASGASLGSFAYSGFSDASSFGETAEDRFLGVQFAGGVKSITITANVAGIEVDHIQYGQIAAVPEPASWMTLALGGVGLLGWRRQRRNGARGPNSTPQAHAL